MRRFLPLLVLALLLTPAIPAYADSGGQSMEGSIVFTDISHLYLAVNLSISYMNIDGNNWSADDIRAALESGNADVRAALDEKAHELFDRMLTSFGAKGDMNTSVKDTDSGSVIIAITGSAPLSEEGCGDIYALMGESGAEFSITLDSLGMSASILILPPEGYLINGKSSHLWDGGSSLINLHSKRRLPENRMDILVDIYRIDTTGEKQQVHTNLTLESEIYGVPYTYDVPLNGSISLEYASIPLIRGLISCGYHEEDEWNSTMDSILRDARELIMGEFPNITFSKSSWEETESAVSIHINASASIPVSEMLSASSLFRKVITQNMRLKLYATEGFVTNYTILIPEGMLLDTVRISPLASYHRIFEDDRHGIFVEIDDGNTRNMNMEIGVLVDMDPLIPLIFAVIVVTGMWFIVLHTLPSRRRKR